MVSVSVKLELAEECVAIIDEIAANLETDRASVLREAVAAYLADYRLEIAESEEALRQLEAGETIPHEEIVAWFESAVARKKESQAA